MRALVLFLFRLATGGYLVVWSCSKLLDTAQAIEISDKFYFGLFSTPVLQNGLAVLGAVLGIFVVLGFLRGFSYSVQAIVLAVPVAAMAYFVSQSGFDLPTGIEASIMVLPSFALFLLSLAPLAWSPDDFLTLDRFIGWRRLGLAQEAADKASLIVPTAAAVAMVAEEAEATAPELEADSMAELDDVEVIGEDLHSPADASVPDDEVKAVSEPLKEAEPLVAAEVSGTDDMNFAADAPEVITSHPESDAPLEVEGHIASNAHDGSGSAEATEPDIVSVEDEIMIDPGLVATVEGHEAHVTH